MEILDIVKGLLEIAKRNEFDTDDICYNCGGIEKHEPTCKFVELIEAAEFYIKYTEGATK